MKQLKTFFTQLLLVASLMLPWATTEALDSFQQAGMISKVSIEGSFIIKGKTYRLASGAVIESTSADRKKFSDFKKGDVIWCKGKILNDVFYVDIIKYEEPDES